MQNGRRGILDIIEAYVDMLLNLIAILVAYAFSIMIFGEEDVPMFSPVTVLLIMLQLILSSFVYHSLNMYRPTRYMRNYHSFPEAFRVNFVYYGAMAVIIAVVTRDGYKRRK